MAANPVPAFGPGAELAFTIEGARSILGAGGGDSFPVGEAPNRPARSDAGTGAPDTMLRDIDAILARLEHGVSAERKRMDALLGRLTDKAA